MTPEEAIEYGLIDKVLARRFDGNGERAMAAAVGLGEGVRCTTGRVAVYVEPLRETPSAS